MMEIPSGLNFHNFYRDCQSEVWFKRRQGETVVQCVMRIAYQADESLLRPTTRNEDSFRISLAVLSFLRENKLQKETLEDFIGFELNLHGKHDFTLTELRRLELYTNLKFLV